jgi:hypothetical protein
MKWNKIIIIAVLFTGGAFANAKIDRSNDINDFDNDNVTIHKLGIEAEIKKAKIQKENMETALKNAIVENTTSEKITKNKSNSDLLESMYELKLKKMLHDIKTGKTMLEEIPEGFLKKKIQSLLLMDQNQMQILLNKLEKQKQELKDLQAEMDLQLEGFEATTATYEETIQRLREMNSKLNIKIKKTRLDLSHQLQSCKKRAEGDKVVKFDESRLEEDADRNLEINNVKINNYIVMGDYVNVSVDFSFFISDTTGEQTPVVTWIEGVKVSPSRKILIPDYGIVRIIAEDGALNFYNGIKLLRSEEYK